MYVYSNIIFIQETYASLSMVVLNSRDQPKNIWLPKECTYIHNGIKFRI